MIYSELCRQALAIGNLAPLGQTEDAELNQFALDAANFLLSEWSLTGLIEPAFKSTTSVLNGAQQIYTMGTGGDFDKRPTQILQVILSNATLGLTRYPEIVEDWATFEALTFPSAPGLPQWVFYNPTFPLGQIAFYPYPNASWTAKVLGNFAWEAVTFAEEVVFPPGYDAVFLYNLAARIRINASLPPMPAITALARDMKSSLIQALPVKDQTRDNLMALRIAGRNVRNWQTDSPR